MSYIVTDQTIVNTPIINLDKNTSILYTDDMGRQTVISMGQQPIINPYAAKLSIPSYFSSNTVLPTIYSSYEYQDINTDAELQQKVMKKIYTNFYNFIIPNQYPYLLNYVKNSKSDYTMVKTKKEYKLNKTKESEYENKLQYIARNVYNKQSMYKDVDKYLDTYDIKWYDIEGSKREIYSLLVDKLKKKLEDLLR
jgi:hypothetical protein